MSRQFDYTVQSIVAWPGRQTPVSDRKRSPFKGSWSRTLEELDRELRHLNAEQVVFRLSLKLHEIRADGQMRANARPSLPGVLLEFVAKNREGWPRLVFRCDRFGFWQDNLLAIALGLEALRKVDRYGITDASDQYSGFKALPASTSSVAMTVQQAIEFLARDAELDAEESRLMAADVNVARGVVRRARARHHPDAGGNDGAFQRVQEAARVLGEALGVKL